MAVVVLAVEGVALVALALVYLAVSVYARESRLARSNDAARVSEVSRLLRRAAYSVEAARPVEVEWRAA